MKIAVTGGSGELGTHLVPYLVEQGHAVVSIDRTLPPLPTLRLPNMPDYRLVDVTNFGEVVAAIRGCEAVIHLAAHRSPFNFPDPVIYTENVTGSYNILFAAETLGIKRVCLASSINAIGGVFSRSPRYDYFPIDEKHPTYAEDPYGQSKWVLEQQADAFARRNDWMTIASLRFHWILGSYELAVESTAKFDDSAVRHLWAYTLLSEASRACLLSLTAQFTGHEAFYIVAPDTAVSKPSQDLIQEYYPTVPLRTEMADTSSFFDSSKAGRILDWHHQEN
ncbi:MAG: NAD(P)-dependent oxidoreductase [Chloroflexi bacterium]|nr:NAD(P)-dependent oxidoreductase [Chloroflexota bacterium]